MSKIYVADYKAKLVREKAKSAPIGYDLYKVDRAVHLTNWQKCREFERYLKTLTSYPAKWLTESMDGKELVEGKDFEIQYQERSSSCERWYKCSEEDYRILNDEFRRIIAVPLPDVQQGKEDVSFTFEHVDYLISKFVCDFAPQHSAIEAPGQFIHRAIKECPERFPTTPSSSPVEAAKVAKAIESLIISNGDIEEDGVYLSHDDLTRVSMSIAFSHPSSWQASQPGEAVEKIIEYIRRNAEKINEHTWKVYKEQILSHVKDAEYLFTQSKQ